MKNTFVYTLYIYMFNSKKINELIILYKLLKNVNEKFKKLTIHKIAQ